MQSRHVSCLLVALVLIAGLGACSFLDSEPRKVCTDVFVMITVDVLMPDGTAADSVAITVREEETGRVFDLCNDTGLCQREMENPYTIFHDGLLDEVSGAGTGILVEGERGELVFEETFVIRDNGCHVEKVSGPDEVRLEGEA